MKPLLQKGLILSSVAVAVSAYAYQQGVGTIATINSDEKIEKIDHIRSENAEERITGRFNRSGNPVRIIWYGNANDNDGKAPQVGAKNEGQIVAKVIARGETTTQSEDRRGAIAIDGIANGIDALGWSAPSNPNNVVFTLNSLENTGSISADTDLQGGKAETHGDIKSYGSGNGVSLVGLADFGKHNAEVGADGIADGYSGATGVSRRSTARTTTRTRAAVTEATPSSPELEKADFEGKTVEIALQNINNRGQIQGKVHAQAAQNISPHTASYKPQFYSVTSLASGNAISASSYVNTIDKITFSEVQNNFAKLGEIQNTGQLSGEAHLQGGQNTTHTHTTSVNSGNGVSALANTGRFAKNKTESAVGNIHNLGEIAGRLIQISGDNSHYQGFHLYSDANALGSGNGVSVTAESSNGQTRSISALATLGNVQNNGRITGFAKVQAGNGMGSLMTESIASGNGVSTYARGNNGKLSSIGDVNNSGIISGQVEVKGGKSDKSVADKTFIAKIESKSNTASLTNWLAPRPISTSNTNTTSLDPETCKWLASGTPGCESNPTTPTTSNHTTANIQTTVSVHSSGNGISAWSHGESDAYTSSTTLGNITNNGVISGYAKVYQGFSQNEYKPVDYRNNGAGISINAETNSVITNAGLISGNHSALLAKGKIDTSFSTTNPDYRSGFKNNINNYGIFAGRMIIGGYQSDANSNQRYKYFDTAEQSNYKVKNAGLYIKLNENEEIEKITQGTDYLASFSQNGKTYQVINAPLTTNQKDSEKIITTAETITNKIINGVGMANGAVFATNNLTLTDSIVNGYKTGLKIGTNAEVNLIGTTINTNGFNVNKSEKPLAILGDDNVNKLTIGNQSVINGDIDLKGGNDELTLADSQAIFNGKTIEMGAGQDTFSFGKPNSYSTTPIRVNYNLSGAEKVVVNQETHLLANAKIQGTDNITLNQDLHYQVLSPEQHALFDPNRQNNISLNGNGKFIVNTTKAKSEYEIKFGGFRLDAQNIRFDSNNVLQSAVFKNGQLWIEPKVVMTAEQAKQKEEAHKQEKQRQQSELDALKAQLEQTAAQLEEAKTALAKTIAAHNEAAQRQKHATEKKNTQENQTPPKDSQNQALAKSVEDLTKQVEKNQQQIDALTQKNQQLNDALNNNNVFDTPYAQAYHSYIESWRATGLNPLEKSALTTDKSVQQATDAVNHYFNQAVEHNIYGVVTNQLAKNITSQYNNILAQSKRLKEQEWNISANGLYDNQHYKQTAKKSTFRASTLAIHYGINSNTTAGIHIADEKTKITGMNNGYLKGKGTSFGGYIRTDLDNISLIGGVIYDQFNLKGYRSISNGYDHYQFDANNKANAIATYTQIKYALPLNEQWKFEPKLGIAYTRIHQKAIEEKGAGGLHIDALHTNRLEANIGQELIGTFVLNNGKMLFKLGADYSILSTEKAAQGHFHQGRNFTIQSEPNQNITRLTTGLGYQWHNGLMMNINAQKAFSSAGDQTSAQLAVGYTF